MVVSVSGKEFREGLSIHDSIVALGRSQTDSTAFISLSWSNGSKKGCSVGLILREIRASGVDTKY